MSDVILFTRPLAHPREHASAEYDNACQHYKDILRTDDKALLDEALQRRVLAFRHFIETR